MHQDLKRWHAACSNRSKHPAKFQAGDLGRYAKKGTMKQENKIISHGAKGTASLEQIVKEISTQIKERGDLPHVTVKRQLGILNELTLFPLAGCRKSPRNRFQNSE